MDEKVHSHLQQEQTLVKSVPSKNSDRVVMGLPKNDGREIEDEGGGGGGGGHISKVSVSWWTECTSISV